MTVETCHRVDGDVGQVAVGCVAVDAAVDPNRRRRRRRLHLAVVVLVLVTFTAAAAAAAAAADNCCLLLILLLLLLVATQRVLGAGDAADVFVRVIRRCVTRNDGQGGAHGHDDQRQRSADQTRVNRIGEELKGRLVRRRRRLHFAGQITRIDERRWVVAAAGQVDVIETRQFDAGDAGWVVTDGAQGVAGGVAGVGGVGTQPAAALLDVTRRRRGVQPLQQRTDDASVAVPRIAVQLHAALLINSFIHSFIH